MALVYRQLPVFEAVKESFRLSSVEIRRHAVPILALAAAYLALMAVAITLPRGLSPATVTSLGLLLLVLAGAITTGFAVGTHRLILQSERRGGLGFFRFDKSTLKYMALFVAIPVAQYLVFIIGGLLMRPLGLVGLIIGVPVALFLVLRFFLRTPLMFPAIAVGDDARLRDCWNQMYGNAIGFLFGAILISAPVGILDWLIENPSLAMNPWVSAPIEAVAFAFTVFLNAIYFSLSYNHLVRHAETAAAG